METRKPHVHLFVANTFFPQTRVIYVWLLALNQWKPKALDTFLPSTNAPSFCLAWNHLCMKYEGVFVKHDNFLTAPRLWTKLKTCPEICRFRFYVASFCHFHLEMRKSMATDIWTEHNRPKWAGSTLEAAQGLSDVNDASTALWERWTPYRLWRNEHIIGIWNNNE